jgi:CheY-like chemotaxis protein
MLDDSDMVLVLEDEEEARTFLVRILEFEGFKALGFPNGAEALVYLKKAQEPCCLIVLDINMPVMNGLQFRSALLGESRLAKIPVVVVTAFDPPFATALSAVRVFRKPVDIDAFIRVVREIC